MTLYCSSCCKNIVFGLCLITYKLLMFRTIFLLAPQLTEMVRKQRRQIQIQRHSFTRNHIYVKKSLWNVVPQEPPYYHWNCFFFAWVLVLHTLIRVSIPTITTVKNEDKLHLIRMSMINVSTHAEYCRNVVNKSTCIWIYSAQNIHILIIQCKKYGLFCSKEIAKVVSLITY